MTQTTWSRAWPIAVLLAAPAVWLARLWAAPTGFLFWQDSAYSDLVISHWPNALFLIESIRTWGQVPAWNPMILSGTPFAADPLAGVWYPATWLCSLLPGALGFNLAVAGHLGLAAVGVYAVLRQQGAGRAGSVLGGLVFSGGAPLVAHAAAGHVSLVYAAAWTPWLVWLLRRAWGAPRPARHAWRPWIALGMAAGMLLLADPRWAPPAALLGCVVAIEAALGQSPSRGGKIAATAGALMIALGISAALLLPMARLALLSTRAGLDSAQQEYMALPLVRLAGYLVPEAAGTPEWAGYAGIVTLLLAVTAVMLRAPRAGMWVGVLVGSIVLAAGDATPIYGWLAHILPGAAWVRVPARYLILSGLALAMLAGSGADSLASLRDPSSLRLRRARLGAVAVGALAAVLGWTLGRAFQPSAAAAPAVLAIAAIVLVLAGLHLAVPRPLVMAGLVVLLCADLGMADAQMVRVRSAEDVLGERAGLASWLAHHLEPGERVFSPSYSVPQQTAATWHLELADGVSPLQLRAYRDALAKASGFPGEDYSVTLPPYPGGDPSQDWSPKIDAEALGRLGVRYVVAEYPLSEDLLDAAGVVDGAYVYRNSRARPRAWVEAPPGGSAHWTPAEITEWTPNRIRVTGAGPGTLVLSEVSYPGWTVLVDGVTAPMGLAHDMLRAVALPRGQHVVEFVYRDWLSIVAAALSALTWLWIVIGWTRW